MQITNGSASGAGDLRLEEAGCLPPIVDPALGGARIVSLWHVKDRHESLISPGMMIYCVLRTACCVMPPVARFRFALPGRRHEPGATRVLDLDLNLNLIIRHGHHPLSL